MPAPTTIVAVTLADDARVSEARTLLLEIAAYYENPVPGTRYLELDLR